MKKDGDIVSYTAEELRAMRARGESRTDLARIDAMTEEELEAAIASDPDWRDVPRDWYKEAEPFFPKGAKRQATLRLDPDVLDWVRRQGRGYQTRINAALRAYIRAREGVEWLTPGPCLTASSDPSPVLSGPLPSPGFAGSSQGKYKAGAAK